jgi:hypothetical protein
MPLHPTKVVYTFENPTAEGTVTLNVTKDLAITEDTLQECFETHAGFLSWYAVLHRNLEFVADTTEDAFDQWCVSEKERLRNPGIKQTEKALDEAVQMHPEYAELQRGVREARRRADILKDFVMAFQERGRMLVRLGYQKATEGEADYHEPSVRKPKKRLDD